MDPKANDAALREAYRRLEERTRAVAGAEIPPETLAALAHGEIPEPEQSRLLDAVLSDPALLQEYELLRALAEDRPRRPTMPRWFLLAASLLVLVGAGLLWRAVVPTRPDLVRGSATDVVLVLPEAEALVSAGSRLVWRPVPGSLGYRAELVHADGRVAFETETSDTVLVLPSSISPAAEESVSWVVSARMPGGNYLRSSPRKLGLRP
jgi:hypothetical protein